MDTSGALMTLGEPRELTVPTLAHNSSKAATGGSTGRRRVGGRTSLGTVFSIDTSGTLTSLHSFADIDGRRPFTGLVEGSDGELLRNDVDRPSRVEGTVFRMHHLGTLTTLHSFSGSDGSGSFEGVTLGPDGSFYGPTQWGGASNLGTVFRIDASGTLTTLHSFTGSDGEFAHSGLVLGSDGSLYGQTLRGGANNFGTVFRIDASGAVTQDTFSQFRSGREPFERRVSVRCGHSGQRRELLRNHSGRRGPANSKGRSSESTVQAR